jgi:hypothetical protein
MDDKPKKIWDIIIKDNFKYFVENVKSPLLNAVILYGMRYPEPTPENVNKPNGRLLLKYFDYFFEHYCNPSRLTFFKAVRRIVIGEYEHDDSYAVYIDLFLLFITRDINDHRWKLNPPNKYTVFWNIKEDENV